MAGIVSVATPQVVESTMTTAILTPIFTGWWYKIAKKNG